MAIVLVAGCTPTFPLDALLQHGHDNPRARTHDHTGQRLRFSGIVEYTGVEEGRGPEVYRATRTGPGEIEIRRKDTSFIVVDVRSSKSVPGHARCRFRGDAREDAKRLKAVPKLPTVGRILVGQNREASTGN